jgi:hypothetical protein
MFEMRTNSPSEAVKAALGRMTKDVEAGKESRVEIHGPGHGIIAAAVCERLLQLGYQVLSAETPEGYTVVQAERHSGPDATRGGIPDIQILEEAQKFESGGGSF